MTSNVSIDTSAEREIVISRLLDAPREMVWAAWTDPKQVAQWWGPNGFTLTIHEMDVRPGGVMRHTMHGPDGTDYPNKSTYIEVKPPELLRYAHGGGKPGDRGVAFEATVTFEPHGDKGQQTLLTMRQTFPSAEMREHVVKTYGAIEGAKQHLGKLSDYLADVVTVERTYDAPVEKVWHALTDVEQMKQWYFPSITAFEPKVGFETRVDVEWEGNVYVHFWKVTEAIPNRKIAYSWRYRDVPGDSVVSFELFPDGDKTRLVLTHTGLASFQKGTTRSEYRSGSTFYGWSHFRDELANFLAKQKGAR